MGLVLSIVLHDVQKCILSMTAVTIRLCFRKPRANTYEKVVSGIEVDKLGILFQVRQQFSSPVITPLNNCKMIVP